MLLAYFKPYEQGIFKSSNLHLLLFFFKLFKSYQDFTYDYYNYEN